MKISEKLHIKALLVLACSGLLISCGGGSNPPSGEGSTPVYQGMTVSRVSPNAKAKAAIETSSSEETSKEPDDHQEHDESIEKEIDDLVTIDVETNDETKYFVKPNEVFIIEVHISNPKDYEIQSFTLNGTKYANYMFKDGSTMELLLLETTAPSESGYYDYTIDAIKYIDGTEIKDVDMSKGEKSIRTGVSYTVAPSAQLARYDVSATYAEMEITIKDPQSVIDDNPISLYLSDGEEVGEAQALKVGQNLIRLEGLTTNTAYQYGVLTAYDYIDGKNLHEEWLLTGEFVTLGAFAFSSFVAGKTDVRFELNRLEDTGSIQSISLYDASTDELVREGDASTRQFDNLLSNHRYNLYVDYLYSSNGQEQSDYVLKQFSTSAKAVPTLDFGNDEVTGTSIKADLELTDEDGIATIESVKLYQGSALVATNEAKQVAFDGLEYYTDYQVVVTYVYDLNDDEGSLTATASKDYKTAPYLEFKSCKVLNTSAISEGDTIYVQATLDNPSGATPVSAVVNGETYACSGSTSATRIYLEIVNNGQFKGGLTELKIEKVNMLLDGKEYSVSPDANNSASVFINGGIRVANIKYVNSKNEPVDYYFVGEDSIYLYIELENETEYVIDSFAFGGDKQKVEKVFTDFEILDASHYRIPIDGDTYFDNYFTCIAYHNEYATAQYYPELRMSFAAPLRLNEVVEISSVDQLLNTDYGYTDKTINAERYYKLTGDIDLSGIEWKKPLGYLTGVFDGNGHKIKNLSNVSTITGKDSLSLFEYMYHGVIRNLTLEDVMIIATMTSADEFKYGPLVRDLGSGSIIENCSVSGDVSVTLPEGCLGYVGGLVGQGTAGGNGFVIRGCSVDISIGIKDKNGVVGYAAGTVGNINHFGEYGSLEISGCSVTGSINAAAAWPIAPNVPHAPSYNVVIENNTFDVLLNGVRVKSEEN